MPQKKNESPLSIMEYFDWVGAQKFKCPEEHHQYVSKQEQDFLQHVVYPMFYRKENFKTSIPFPLILKNFSKPKYVIDNEYFTIIFFSRRNYDYERFWEVSVHVKDHDFCDKPITEFKSWYRKHYYRLFAEMVDMPEMFNYPQLNLYDNSVKDFCIEFWNDERDYLFFKLLDLLRLF